MIATPGAETSGLTRPSKVGPRLEKYASRKPSRQAERAQPDALGPVSAMAPTVIAFAASPGLATVQADGPLFPAAIVATMPAATAPLTATEIGDVPSPH